MGLIIATPPSTEPVSLAEAKRQCRVHTSDTTYDAEIQAYLNAAISHLDGPDGVLQRALEPQTWDLFLDEFSDTIELPLRPVISVDTILYYDTDGIQQGVNEDSYTVDLASESAWVVPNSDFSWPETQDSINAVQIRFTAGYEGELDSGSYVSATPDAIRQAILLLVAHWFSHRSAVEMVSSGDLVNVPLAFDALVGPYKRLILA